MTILIIYLLSMEKRQRSDYWPTGSGYASCAQRRDFNPKHRSKSQQKKDKKREKEILLQKEKMKIEQPTRKKISLDIFNAQEAYKEILQQANNSQQFLQTLKYHLTETSLLIRECSSIHKKQRQKTRDQDSSKSMQALWIKNIHGNLKSILALKGIKYFNSREAILKQQVEKIEVKQGIKVNQPSIEYSISDQQWELYEKQQQKLMEMLLKQLAIVSHEIVGDHKITPQSWVQDHKGWKEQDLKKDSNIPNWIAPQVKNTVLFNSLSLMEKMKIQPQQWTRTGLKQTEIHNQQVNPIEMPKQLRKEDSKMLINKYTQEMTQLMNLQKELNEKQMADKILELSIYMIHSYSHIERDYQHKLISLQSLKKLIDPIEKTLREDDSSAQENKKQPRRMEEQ